MQYELSASKPLRKSEGTVTGLLGLWKLCQGHLGCPACARAIGDAQYMLHWLVLRKLSWLLGLHTLCHKTWGCINCGTMIGAAYTVSWKLWMQSLYGGDCVCEFAHWLLLHKLRHCGIVYTISRWLGLMTVDICDCQISTSALICTGGKLAMWS